MSNVSPFIANIPGFPGQWSLYDGFCFVTSGDHIIQVNVEDFGQDSKYPYDGVGRSPFGPPTALSWPVIFQTPKWSLRNPDRDSWVSAITLTMFFDKTERAKIWLETVIGFNLSSVSLLIVSSFPSLTQCSYDADIVQFS